jgi:tetratricopeptide (TPR) repeat protein
MIFRPSPRLVHMRLTKAVIAILLLTALAAGAYWAYRDISRSAERAEALRLASERQDREAIPKLERALERSPDDVEVLAALVECMANVPSYNVDDLLPLLNRWCRLAPDDHLPHLKRMNAMLALDRNEEALRDAQVVLRVRPDQYEVRCVAARLLRDLGRYEEAGRECEILLATDSPFQREILFLQATVFNDRGDYESARKVADQILAGAPDYPAALMLRGEAAFRLGNYEEATGYLRKASGSRVFIIRRNALQKLGDSLRLLGKKEEAQEVLNRLLTLQDAFRAKEDAKSDPTDRGLQLRAARALLASDFPGEASSILEALLRSSGPDKEVENLLVACREKISRAAAP